jgi:molybdate transport system substrate-binding protein
MSKLLAAALSLASLALAGGAGATARADRPTVFAAASLTNVFPKLQRDARYEFGGSNTLLFQIEQGAPVDVFASASPTYVQQLQTKHLTAGKPVWFLSNRIVLVVPRSNPAHIRKPADLLRPGVRLVIGAHGVPAGDYARTSLHGMGLDAALKNVVSEEPDVESVLAKIVSGDADAAFVYTSDFQTVKGKATKIPLPPAGRYVAVYGAVALADAPHPAAARAFVKLLGSARAQQLFRADGFRRAPARR